MKYEQTKREEGLKYTQDTGETDQGKAELRDEVLSETDTKR